MNEKSKGSETSVPEMKEYLDGRVDSDAQELLAELNSEKTVIGNEKLENLRKRFASYLEGKITDLQKELSELKVKLKGAKGKDAKELNEELEKNYIAKLSGINKSPTKDLKLIKDIGREFVSFRSRVEFFLKQSPIEKVSGDFVKPQVYGGPH